MTKKQDKADQEEEQHLSIDRNEYVRLKRRLIKFEQKNNQFVAVIPCDGDKGWYEMGETSALIYKYRICMPMGKPVSLVDDGDSFYLQYEYGRIRIRDVGAVRKRLQKAGMYKSEQEKDHCFFFRLKSPYSQAEITRMREDEIARQATINSIIKVDFADPALFQKLTEVATRLHRICLNRMDKISRELNGKTMVRLMDNTLRCYYRISLGIGEGEDKLKASEVRALWQEMIRSAHLLLVELQIAAGLKIWDREVCASIGKDIDEVIRMTERGMQQYAVRHRGSD